MAGSGLRGPVDVGLRHSRRRHESAEYAVAIRRNDSNTANMCRLRLPAFSLGGSGSFVVAVRPKNLMHARTRSGSPEPVKCRSPKKKARLVAGRNGKCRRLAARYSLNSGRRPPNCSFKRATMLLCIWLTRDSESPSVVPISFIVSSS